MAKTQKIEPRTKRFAEIHKELSDKKLMPSHEKLAEILGYDRKQSITEILKQRQNIDFEKWVKFLNHFHIEEPNSTEMSGLSMIGKTTPDHSEVDYKEKYYALLEKENAAKDKTIEKLSLAVDHITVIDNKVEGLKITVDDLKYRWKEYGPMILGLREFVTVEIASLKRQSREEVAAALNIKVEEQRQKV